MAFVVLVQRGTTVCWAASYLSHALREAMHPLDLPPVSCAQLGMHAATLISTALSLVLLAPIQWAMPHLAPFVQLDLVVLQQIQPLIPVLLVHTALWAHCLAPYVLQDHTAPLWTSYLYNAHQVYCCYRTMQFSCNKYSSWSRFIDSRYYFVIIEWCCIQVHSVMLELWIVQLAHLDRLVQMWLPLYLTISVFLGPFQRDSSSTVPRVQKEATVPIQGTLFHAIKHWCTVIIPLLTNHKLLT